MVFLVIPEGAYGAQLIRRHAKTALTTPRQQKDAKYREGSQKGNGMIGVLIFQTGNDRALAFGNPPNRGIRGTLALKGSAREVGMVGP